MMDSKGTVVVLAGTRPHAELIKNLKTRGYRTVLIDYTENPCAKAFADRHSTESTLDPVAVERIAREENAIRIMDICVDRPIPVAAYVAEKMGLEHPITYASSLVVTNKNLMKKFMLENGIPSSRFIPVTDAAQIDGIDLRYPLMVKPSDASGSIGISRVETENELLPAVENALSLSRNGQAIVEEFVSGPEIQIDCFVESGKAVILDIKEKRMISKEMFSLPYGSIIPVGITVGARAAIDDICKRLVDSLAIKNGPLYIQAIASGDDVRVIEFGVRFGGGLSFKIIKDVAGVDIIDVTAEAYLGGKPHVENRFDSFVGVYASFHVFPKAGFFSEVTGYQRLLDEGFFEYFAVNKHPGDRFEGDLSSKERVAAFILKAESHEALDLKLRTAIESIDILDVEGNSIMRKDIYNI